MPLNGTIKNGQNFQMVKFYVIHILQLLTKKENGGGGTRQEEDEERRQREPERRCRFRGSSERESSTVGGLGGSPKPPRRRGGTGHQHAKEAQQQVQPRRSSERVSPLPTVSMAGGGHGHRTLIPATVSGPSLHQHQRGSPTPLPSPIITFARAKGTGPTTWGCFCITIFKSALLL